jgi:large subunit ribosomal protein L29
MKMSELRELGREDLLEKLKKLEKELLDLRIQAAQGKMTTPSKKRQIKKDVARIKTLLKERELGIRRGA